MKAGVKMAELVRGARAHVAEVTMETIANIVSYILKYCSIFVSYKLESK